MNLFHLIVHARLPTQSSFVSTAANAFDMARSIYHYIFTNLDTHTMDMHAYRRKGLSNAGLSTVYLVNNQSGCNITTVRLIDPANEQSIELERRLKTFLSSSNAHSGFVMPVRGVPVSIKASSTQ